MIETRSTQNQPFKYLCAIFFRSVTSVRPPVLSKYARRKFSTKSLKKHKSIRRLMKNRASMFVARNPTSNGVTTAVHNSREMVTYSHRRMYADRGSTTQHDAFTTKQGRSSDARSTTDRRLICLC